MEILFALPFIAWLVFWLYSLYDLARWSEDAWSAAGESRMVWFVLVLILQFFGVLGYWAMVRPKLVSARE